MVTTKHCCWGDCKSDSQNVYFIGFGNSFPKPSKDRTKCLRWVNSCGRKYFTINNVNKDTYICSRHFVGGHGPTEENPDPIKCGEEVTRNGRKRNVPSRGPIYKSAKQQRTDQFDAAEALLQLPTSASTTTTDDRGVSNGPEEVEKTNAKSSENTTEYAASPFEKLFNDASVMCIPETKNTASQTEITSEIVNLRLKNKALQNELVQLNFELETLHQSSEQQSTSEESELHFHYGFGVDCLKDDDAAFEFYTGMTFEQFMCLWNFLGVSTTKISYWDSGVHEQQKTPSHEQERPLSQKDELFMTLVKLRVGL